MIFFNWNSRKINRRRILDVEYESLKNAKDFRKSSLWSDNIHWNISDVRKSLRWLIIKCLTEAEKEDGEGMVNNLPPICRLFASPRARIKITECSLRGILWKTDFHPFWMNINCVPHSSQLSLRHLCIRLKKQCNRRRRKSSKIF